VVEQIAAMVLLEPADVGIRADDAEGEVAALDVGIEGP
jgi:hypothetical protein